MTAQALAPERSKTVPEKELKISKTLSLPIDAWRWTIADLAIKNAGKTYAASVLAEEMMKNGIPIIAVDPVGIWWGLRAGADETKAGYPVVIFGGDHKDIAIPTRIDSKSKFPQIDEDRLKLMVKSILEAGISAVIDTSEFSKHMQRRASTIILRELFQLNKKYGRRHVFLEEVDTLAPQRLSGELNESFGAVDEVIRRGGNFLLGATIVSQRPAVVNKDILTQCNCLIILRILAKLDKDAVATWVKEISGKDPKKYNKWYDSLKDLKNGEAWIWHPESDLFEKIQFRKRETLHATREYFEQEAWEQKNISLMDASDFIAKFKSKFEPKKLPEKTVGEGIAQGYEKAAKQANIIPTSSQVETATQFLEQKQAEKPFQRMTMDVREPERGHFVIEDVPSMNFADEAVDVKINTTFRPENFTTDNAEGKIMFVLCSEFGGKFTDIKEIKGAIREHIGWVMDDSTFSNSKKTLKQRNMVIEDTNSRIRLPVKVHGIFIDGRQVM